VKENEVGRSSGTHGEERNAYNVIPEGMKTLNKSRSRWKYNIKMYFK